MLAHADHQAHHHPQPHHAAPPAHPATQFTLTIDGLLAVPLTQAVHANHAAFHAHPAPLATSQFRDHWFRVVAAVHAVVQLAFHQALPFLLIVPVQDIVHFTKTLYQAVFNVCDDGIVRLL